MKMNEELRITVDELNKDIDEKKSVIEDLKYNHHNLINEI